MQIEFEVDGQRLIRTSEAYMISGSENFVECVFDFSNDWERLDKWAVFIQGKDVYKISIVNNTCLIPIECTAIEGEFTIHIVGCKDAENIIATTNEKLLIVRPSILFPAIKSYIQKIIEYIKSLKQDTESAKQEAVSAKQEAVSANAEIKTIYNSGGLTPITDLAGSIGTAIKRWGYIFANKVFAMNLPIVYKSVAEMKADSLLSAGMTACTLGYGAPNDGGGATYIIRAKQESDVDDGGSLHELANRNVAELVVENGTVNVKQFGAKGDGVTNDSLKINQCLNTFKSIVLPSGTYLAEQTIMLNPGQVIKGQYANSVIETRAAIAFDVNSQCKLSDFKVVIKQNGVNTVFLVDEKSIDNQLTNSAQDNIVFDNIIVQTLKFEVSPSFTVFEIKNESENKGMYGIIINKIKALCNRQKYFCRAYAKNPAWLSTVTFSDCYLVGFEWFYFMAKSDDFSNNSGYSGCSAIIIHDNCIQPTYNYSKAFIYLLNTTAELNGNVLWDTSKFTYSGKPYFINKDFLQNKQVFAGSQRIESWQCVSENKGVFKEMSYAQAQYNGHLQPASDTTRYPLGIPRGGTSVKGTLIFKGNFPANDILLMFWIANRYGLFPVMIKNDKWYSSANLSKEITFGYKVIEGKRLIYAVTPIGASNQTTTMFIPLPITNSIFSAGADIMTASTNHVYTINLVERNSDKIVDEAELYYLEQPNDLTMLDFELNPNYAVPPSDLTSIS